MKMLSEYISGLLRTNDCVIVPGFGAFISNIIEAEIKHGKIYPRRKVLNYNPGLLHDDGLLVNHYAKLENLDYTKAREVIKDCVESAWVHLQRGENIELEEIGSFTFDRNQKLIFDPDLRSNLLKSSYGLEVVELEKVSGIIEINTKKGRKHILKPVLAVSALALVLSVFPIRKDSGASSESSSFISMESVERMFQSEHHMPENTILDADKKADQQANIAKQNVNAVTERSSLIQYHIIAGGFREKNNALKQQAILKTKGMDAIILQSNNGLYLVSVSQSDNLSVVRNKLRSYKENYWGMESAWVYRRK